MTELFARLDLPLLFVLMVSNGFISAPPSELILTTAGAHAVRQGQSLIAVVFCGSAGNLLGTYILYLLGRRFGLERSFHFFQRLASRMGMGSRRSEAAHSWVLYLRDVLGGSSAAWIGIFRCLPVVRSIVSLPCGALGVPQLRFLVYSATGILVWNTAWVCVGAFGYAAYARSERLVFAILLVGTAVVLWQLHRQLRSRYGQWKALQDQSPEGARRYDARV